jgi:hypothetical protein
LLCCPVCEWVRRKLRLAAPSGELAAMLWVDANAIQDAFETREFWCRAAAEIQITSNPFPAVLAPRESVPRTSQVPR